MELKCDKQHLRMYGNKQNMREPPFTAIPAEGISDSTVKGVVGQRQAANPAHSAHERPGDGPIEVIVICRQDPHQAEVADEAECALQQARSAFEWAARTNCKQRHGMGRGSTISQRVYLSRQKQASR